MDGCILCHFFSTSWYSTLGVDVSASSSQCSKAWFRSWLIKSDDFKSRNTSNGEVQCNVCVAEIHAASWEEPSQHVVQYHFVVMSSDYPGRAPVHFGKHSASQLSYWLANEIFYLWKIRFLQGTFVIITFSVAIEIVSLVSYLYFGGIFVSAFWKAVFIIRNFFNVCSPWLTEVLNQHKKRTAKRSMQMHSPYPSSGK